MISVLTYVLLFVEVVVSFLLIGIILIQRTKAQGMGLAFGSGMGESLFGSQMGNVLTKTTVILAIVFLVNTTLLAMIGAGRGSGSVTDGIAGTAPVAPTQAPAGQQMPFDQPAAGQVPEMPVGDMPLEAPAAPMDGDAPSSPQE